MRMVPRLFAAAYVVVALTFFAGMAVAQDVIVDGETLTSRDIDQRLKADSLGTHQPPSREQVIDELRREILALHEARRRGRDVSDAAVDEAYAAMAKRMHLTAEQLTRALAQQGIADATLKRHIRADLAWASSVRSRFPPTQ
jgi:hypothetical protein